MKRVIIAGGRNFVPSTEDELWLMTMLKSLKATLVVSGGAKGADKFGETIAAKMHITVKTYPANWEKYVLGAGPIRNIKMADNADVLIAFEGGKGTAHMIKTATQKGLQVIQRLAIKETE